MTVTSYLWSALAAHRGDFFDSRVIQQPSIFGRTDRVKRYARRRVMVHAPAELLGQRRCAQTRLGLHEKCSAGLIRDGEVVFGGMDREQQIVAGHCVRRSNQQRIVPPGDAIGLWRDDAARRRAVRHKLPLDGWPRSRAWTAALLDHPHVAAWMDEAEQLPHIWFESYLVPDAAIELNEG